MAGVYVIYGECRFPSNGQRNSAQSTIESQAPARGLTPFAWSGFPAGVARVTLAGQPGLRYCYSGPTYESVEAAGADAQAALVANGYDGEANISEV